MGLTWASADLKTGAILAYLPDLSCPSVSQVIGAFTSTTASLPMPTAPDGWQRATMSWASVLVLLDDDLPIWGGVVNKRPRTLGPTVEIPLVTIEAYFDRRYVSDHTFTPMAQTTLAASMVTAHADTVPFRVIDGGSTTLRDHTYKDSADKSLYSALQELSGVIGGPEWTCWWEWNAARDHLTPVFEVRDRLGSSPMAGLKPAATFDAPGCLVDATWSEDYSKDKGANDVLAVSTGTTTDSRPQSAHHVGASERPKIEYRYTPSTSITDTTTLDAHAAAALAAMVGGRNALSLVADMDSAPRLGRDWWIGDDIGVDIDAPALTLDMTTRALGWVVDLAQPTKITPIVDGGD